MDRLDYERGRKEGVSNGQESGNPIHFFWPNYKWAPEIIRANQGGSQKISRHLATLFPPPPGGSQSALWGRKEERYTLLVLGIRLSRPTPDATMVKEEEVEMEA